VSSLSCNEGLSRTIGPIGDRNGKTLELALGIDRRWLLNLRGGGYCSFGMPRIVLDNSLAIAKAT
jgi:hypothetical protein